MMSSSKTIFKQYSMCNDHIGGMLGEVLLHHFLKHKLLEKQGEDFYYISKKGYKELEILGIDIDNLKSTSNNRVIICFESEFGIFYEHIGSLLGKLIFERMLEMNWIEKINEVTIKLTPQGFEGFQNMGIILIKDFKAT